VIDPQRPEVLVSASGVVSAFGASGAALWEGLLAGATCVGPCPELGLDLDGQPLRAARVPDEALGPELAGAGRDRTAALVSAAARQLLAAPAWATVQPDRLGVCLGTTQGPIGAWTADQLALAHNPAHRPAPPSLAAPTVWLARLLGARGPVACPSMACATATAAIGIGLDWIRAGVCDAVVAGGADALSPLVHAGFGSLKALDPLSPRPFDRDRAGLGTGEGAALVLLQRAQADLPPRAPRLLGWAQSADANHLTGPDPTGAGVARALRGALADAGIAAEEVDFVNAHGTATSFNDLMEGKALLSVLGDRTPHVPVNSIKGAIGHTMAAAGAIEAVLCALVLEHGLIPATTGLTLLDPEIRLDLVIGRPRAARVRTALSTSSGFGGVNAAIVLRA